jgi:hypothetical protein
VVRRGIPRGFHVTLYASNLTSAQYSAALSQPLGKLPDYHTIEFTSFNVTRESDDKHYFDESGNVVWAQTRREAALEDGDWEQAVAAAVRIYTDLGLVVSEASLYKQLHDMGRKAPVSARDVIAAPKPKAATVTSPTAFKPRCLLVGRPKAPAPPTATPSSKAPCIRSSSKFFNHRAGQVGSAARPK